MADWYNAGGEFYSYISLHFTAYCRGREDLIIGQKDIVEKHLEEYVNDYKIHVFEISWLTDEQVKMFKSDFRIVADFFTQIRKNNNYIPSTATIEHVDEVLKLLSVFGHEDELIEVIEMKNSKEVKNMGGFYYNAKLKAKAEALINAVENLQSNLGLPLEDAIKALGETMESYQKAKSLIG